MRSTLLVGFIVLTAASARAAAPSDGYDSPVHWQGFVTHDGVRTPIAVDLSQVRDEWGGRLNNGGNDVALDDVRITTTSVHFEAPGQGVFDGEIAGDQMAGKVSGDSTGSFSLSRDDSHDYDPYFLGP
jgi:hypothetical protein